MTEHDERTASAGAAPGAPPSEAALNDLRKLVRKGTRRWKRLVLLEAAGLAVASPLAYLWLVFLLDTVLHLPVWGRVLASAAFVAAVLWQAARLVSSWRRARFTDDQVALAIERNTAGGLENRLINSIQLARDGRAADPAIREAVVRENVERLRQIHVEQAARSRPAVVRLSLAAALVLAGLLFRSLQPDRFGNAAARILLPFAKVEPVYRTVLTVEPGDVEIQAGDDVAVRVRIEGRIPPALAVIRSADGQRDSVEVRVPPRTNGVEYVFRNVRRTTSYAVRGGDYVTPFYTIGVPVPAELQTLRVTYEYPEYTGLPARTQEGSSGDLEALYGTRAELRFTLNRPADAAALLLEEAGGAEPDGAGAPTNRLALARLGPAEFGGRLVFNRTGKYRLETVQQGRTPAVSRLYDIRVAADREPELQVVGLKEEQESAPDAVLPLAVSARDDYGLLEVGLFARPAGADEAAWQPVRTWAVEGRARAFGRDCPVPAALTGAAEGETVELAARARDTDPLRAGAWATGERYRLTLGGEGSALQAAYEQILKSEGELRRLEAETGALGEKIVVWVRKLEPASGLRWDDRANLDALAAGMRELAAEQSRIRAGAAEAARGIVEDAGSLRLSVAMLADTEMVRSIRILEGVAARDGVQDKRAAAGEARLTAERMARSLREMLDRYVEFRRDWELEHMVPFVRMLAQRQERMGAESVSYSALSAEIADERLRAGTARRQDRVLGLAGLAQTAFGGLAGRSNEVGVAMADAFAEAAAGFDGRGVKRDMARAAGHLREGRWAEAATNQAAAAAALAELAARLTQVQADVARQALADLRELAAESPEAQADIRQLRPGSAESLLEADPDETDLPEIVRMQKLAAELKKKHDLNQDDQGFPDYAWNDSMRGALQGEPAETQDFSIMRLAKAPGGQNTFPSSSDLEGNKMKMKLIEQQYEDIVGDLLEEADDLRETYETYNMNKGGQGIEEGDVGKQAGDLNSVSAAAATGNQKPPTHDFGGASRIGRQGARAHGAVVGDESVDRRGRDEAQEGQQVVPDQPGLLKETKSDDPQKDSSTGVGGKEIKSDQTSFSVKDAGEWTDDIAERMKDPQAKNQIVERKGKPLNPKVAEMLRDLESTQEQVIERIKTLRKELDNLYLPTEHLDEIARELQGNLDRLKEDPDADVYRLQVETLDKLKGAVVVFNRPSSEFQPSLARDQAVRGEILDEPSGPALPGYEDIVKRYYEKLAQP